MNHITRSYACLGPRKSFDSISYGAGYEHNRGCRIALWGGKERFLAADKAARSCAGCDVLALEAPTDAAYGELRARLEEAGKLIGANDLLIAAHALALDHTLVTDNEREFLTDRRCS